MIKVETEINKKAKDALNKKAKIIYVVLMCVGIVGLGTYIVLSGFFQNKYLEFLLLFAIPFAIGFVYYATLVINSKKNQTFSNTYEFYEDHVMVSTSKDKEVVGTYKLYYKDVKKLKETSDYLFIYVTRRAAYIVDKQNVKEEDLQKIKDLIKKVY